MSDIIPTCPDITQTLEKESSQHVGMMSSIFRHSPTLFQHVGGMSAYCPERSPTLSQHIPTSSRHNSKFKMIFQLTYMITSFFCFTKLMLGFYQIPTSSQRMYPDIAQHNPTLLVRRHPNTFPTKFRHLVL